MTCQSDSYRLGKMSAISSSKRGIAFSRARGPNAVRILASATITSTRSPAEPANAVSSMAASTNVSNCVPSAERLAASRPESMTITTRRSRSGRHVLTMTSWARAVARQSIERTSSPGTYSRSESNSVPIPRTMSAVRPSSSRRRCRREGRWRLDRNGGVIATWAGTSNDT